MNTTTNEDGAPKRPATPAGRHASATHGVMHVIRRIGRWIFPLPTVSGSAPPPERNPSPGLAELQRELLAQEFRSSFVAQDVGRLTIRADAQEHVVMHIAAGSAGEIRNALRWLHGTRVAVRKHQRRRLHLTYRQRDAIAALLVRLTGVHNTMTPQAWIEAFAQYLGQVADITAEDAQQEGELEAQQQQSQFGDDASLWQSPTAAAQQTANEWTNTPPLPVGDHNIVQPPDDEGEEEEPSP